MSRHLSVSAFPVGSRVVKNPATWRPSEFDSWGAGVGVGVVVGVPYPRVIDVRWPSGRAYQDVEELMLARSEGDESR